VNNAGAVFKLMPDGTETILYSFKGKPSDGNFPYAGLFQGSDGNFYGTTEFGGENNLGVIFELTPDGVETILYSFTGGPDDGGDPFGNLVQGSDGNLYGLTIVGGASNKGTFFKFALN